MSNQTTRDHEEKTRTAPLTAENWNFKVLLVQGKFVNATRYLASPRLVIPFLYIAIGAPVFIAGLLLPLVQFSRLGTQVVAAIGGFWTIVISNVPALQNLIAHGLVFSLVAAGTQAVVGARTLYVVNTAPEDQRPYFIAIGNTISGTIGILLAFLFSTIAHFQGVLWPVVLITGLNVLAGVSSLRSREGS